MSALVRLAELHGIALEYHDVWGKLHVVAETTLRSLLAAMGVAGATDAEVEQSLAAGLAAQWREIVAPVAVVRERSQPKLRVHLRAAWDAAPLQWRLNEEQGAERRGALEPGDFAAVERTTLDGEALIARELLLPVLPPPGYHRLALRSGSAVIAETLLIVVPVACFSPPAIANGGIWGVAAQLYGVRSERNWGIGDFTDLATLVGLWAAKGADVVGVNPLHALFPHDPTHASPYSPSSRLFLNILYLDVEAIADFVECESARALSGSAEFQAALARLREGELVDYAGVAKAKLRVLEMLYAHFRAKHFILGSERADAFRDFCAQGGEALRLHGLFDAIQEHFFAEDAAIRGWPAWPESFRDPSSPAVERFATEHAERVEYYEYLQWQADLQLGAVRARVVARHLGVGLYVDLAVSIDRAGADAWTHQRVLALGASVGAPPDEFNMRGQNWGLPPLIPDRLRLGGYAPFIDTLRANMRHAGALRIDHVMGLMRLFWVPDGRDADEGAYVRYPFADLLGILALESQRHRCLVIGEDLGTVPEEVRTALAAAGVLSYRLLFFERAAAGEFKLPSTYPAQALVAASTHDLPTLAGWWEGRDIALRDELGLFPTEATRGQQQDARKKDRAGLLLALQRESLLPDDVSLDAETTSPATPPMTAALARAVQAFLARTPSQVLVVQLEDVVSVGEQANLPATVDTHPNWRRKLPLALEHWPDDRRFVELTETLRRSRPHRPPAGHAPRATYRLQLHREFTFADATRLVPYLAALGVSHVYCSPYLRARAGSRHGYDIVDHAALNPEIGDRAAFDRFAQALADHAMGQIVDVVPNHMAVMGADNAWWMDVLENGQASVYADHFDIDWHPPDPDLAGKVLVPVLGDHYGRVLEQGELQLRYETETGAFAVHYHEHRLPIDPREYPVLLDRTLAESAQTASPLPEAATSVLASIAAAFRHLPARDDLNPAHVAERNRDKELHKARLAALLREHSALAASIEQTVRRVNGTPGDAGSFVTLHKLLEAQAYRVAFWRVASDEINYRRFFDINDLAALRMENEAVFEATHRFVLDLAAEGKVHGFRIDHPDGLYDPAAYFERLQQRYASLTRQEGEDRTPLYVVVEKIEAPHERLPAGWRIHGTTGYRFANLLNGVFVDTAARMRIDRAWRAFVGGEASDFGQTAHDGKRRVMQTSLTAELSVLANRLRSITRADRSTRDLTLSTLSQALLEIAACFPVYRTYVAATISAQDRRYIDWALAVARKKSRNADVSAFDFIRDVLLVRPPDGAQATLDAYRAFAMRFQQFSAPVTAKGVEDTSFYIFNRLVSLNEVGGDPDQFGTSVKAFHRANAKRLAHWPDTMLAGSTHDNKRSADVRARIDVVSEMPAAWRLRVRRWSRINRTRKRTVDDLPAPSRNDEYLLYQTLVGTFPAEELDPVGLERYRARIEQYMIKAAREAKLHTSWLTMNEEYESALKAFVAALLDGVASNAFLADLRSGARAFAWFGALNSIAMSLLHFTAPGVPDIYQGNEIIDLSLVDPDNRRAVDYALRAEMLGRLEAIASGMQESLAARVHALLAAPHDGRLKMWVTWRSLALRRQYPELFARGEYVPITVAGERARHAVAYARRQGSSGIIAVAGRLFASLGLEQGVAPVGEDAWGNATLGLDFLPPATQLYDVLTGAAHPVTADGVALARVFAAIPVALLRYETPA